MKISSKDIIFVLLQVALFIAFTFEIKTIKVFLPPNFFWFGVVVFVLGALITVVAVLQLNVHLSPFPSPLPGSKLIESGVYKFIRHPIYTGIMLAFFGYALISDSGYRFLITIALYVLFHYKSVYEEKRLIETFAKYSEYKGRTGRFFPKIVDTHISK